MHLQVEELYTDTFTFSKLTSESASSVNIRWLKTGTSLSKDLMLVPFQNSLLQHNIPIRLKHVKNHDVSVTNGCPSRLG